MRRFSHFMTLFGILCAFLVGFVIFSWDKAFQLSLVIAAMASYVSWGIVHHFLHDDLYIKVVVEYLGIAVLGSILAISLLL